MIFDVSGAILLIFGLLVTVVFWLPPVFNRNKMKEMLGNRYPLVYVVYIANGPMLMIIGILLLLWSRLQH